MWGHAPPEKCSNLEAQKCHFLRFPQEIFIFLRYTAANLQVTWLKYALLAPANKNFQKQTIFVFTESWSRDQLLQKAYSKRQNTLA